MGKLIIDDTPEQFTRVSKAIKIAATNFDFISCDPAIVLSSEYKPYTKAMR